MMNNKIVSVIIPTYNMHDYLGRCLESVLSHDIEKDVEVIVVNDGSTDDSLLIAQKLQLEYPEELTIIDKINGNYGSTINAALPVAKGRYIRILDADDCFDKVAFQKYVCALKKVDVDMILTHWCIRSTKKRVVFQFHNIKYNECLNFRDVSLKATGNLANYIMPSVTFQAQLLRDMNYRQTEGISYTDTEYLFYPLFRVKTFSLLDVMLYQYHVGRDEQTVSVKSLRKNFAMYRFLGGQLVEYYHLHSHAVCDNCKEVLRKILLQILSGYFSSQLIVVDKKTYNDNKELSLNLYTYIKVNTPEVCRDLNDSTYHHIPYVKLWRTTGLRMATLFQLIQTIKSAIHN